MLDELRPVVGLRPDEYEHQLDRQALKILKSSRGFDSLMKKLHTYGLDAFAKFPYLGSGFRITEAALPEVHAVLDRVCEVLDVSTKPELYVTSGSKVEGFAVGVDHPIIILTSAAVDNLKPPELAFVIGHELGHIKSGHLLYRLMAEIMPMLGGLAGSATLGVGSLLSKGLEIALVNWGRISDYSADRAGLLACQDIQVAGKILMRLAGVPLRYANAVTIEAFMYQARNMAIIDIKGLDSRLVNLFWQNQSWAVARAHYLLAWYDDGGYKSVLNREFLTKRCPACGKEVEQGLLFCTQCGASVAGAAELEQQTEGSPETPEPPMAELPPGA